MNFDLDQSFDLCHHGRNRFGFGTMSQGLDGFIQRIRGKISLFISFFFTSFLFNLILFRILKNFTLSTKVNWMNCYLYKRNARLESTINDTGIICKVFRKNSAKLCLLLNFHRPSDNQSEPVSYPAF